MSQLNTFPFSTPNIGLPLLMAGQAQKEFFLNQALGILDALLRNSINASRPAPPLAPVDGQCFRVTAPALEAWAGCEDHIAIRIGDDWHFIPPRDGMRLFDSEAGHALFYRATWEFAEVAAVPSTGAVIDSEARAALAQLIQTLRDFAIIGPVAD